MMLSKYFICTSDLSGTRDVNKIEAVSTYNMKTAKRIEGPFGWRPGRHAKSRTSQKDGDEIHRHGSALALAQKTN